jgi:RNA polymerase sigma factor (sigma-70 family)
LKRNPKAERLLWDKYAPQLFGVCMRYCRNRSEAEEVLQEGFIKIFDRLSQYKQNGSFEHWLRRIMINTALTYLRLSKKFVNELDVYELGEVFLTDTNPLKQLEAKDLMKLIQVLPLPQQSVMNLFSIDGYSHQEIAHLLGISEAASRVMLHRAKAKLIELCGDKYDVPKKYGSK